MSFIQLSIARLIFAGYLFLKTVTFYLKKFWYIAVAVLLILILISGKLLIFPSYHKNIYEENDRKTVLIPKGSSLRQIAQILKTEHLLNLRIGFFTPVKFPDIKTSCRRACSLFRKECIPGIYWSTLPSLLWRISRSLCPKAFWLVRWLKYFIRG